MISGCTDRGKIAREVPTHGHAIRASENPLRKIGLNIEVDRKGPKDRLENDILVMKKLNGQPGKINIKRKSIILTKGKMHR